MSTTTESSPGQSYVFPHNYSKQNLDRVINNIKSQHRPSHNIDKWSIRDYYNTFDKIKIEQLSWLEALDVLQNKKVHQQAVTTNLYDIYNNNFGPNATPTTTTITSDNINNQPQNASILNFVKGIDRLDFSTFTPDEFRHNYEFKSIPVIIKDGIDNWPCKDWTCAKFHELYHKASFRIGDDDDGAAMRVPFELYAQYLETQQDDSPLYLFEDDFGERKDSQSILDNYKPIKYFDEDLFLLTPLERRPPFRWVIVGSQRTGTKMHIVCSIFSTSFW